MRFAALASGSSGNCFYVESKDNAILIDAGISCKQIAERLASLGKKPEIIRGIFITHEHADHVKGADVFSREFSIPIFATKKTAKNCFLCSDPDLVQEIKNNETTKIEGMEIEAFSKSHKASDPVSFSIDKKISVITDAGYACENVTESVRDSSMLCLESNHDTRMLENGPYPWHLKKWIASDTGHLSNLQAGLLVLEHGSSRLKNIVLAHLSQTNNTPLLALESMHSLVKERKKFNPRISLSLRNSPTKLFKV